MTEKTKQIFVRVDEATKRKLRRAARLGGETLSGWIRRILMREADRTVKR